MYTDKGYDQFLHKPVAQTSLTKGRSSSDRNTLYDTLLGPGGALAPADAADMLSQARISSGTFEGRFKGVTDASEFTFAGATLSLNGGDAFVTAVTSPTGAGSAHTHTITPGTFYFTHACPIIKGSANTDSENADSAAAPTNATLLKAEDTFTNYAGTITPTTNPDIGRNIAIIIHNDSGGALNLFEGTTTFTVTGTYKGSAQTDSITFTSTAGNKSVANNQYRYKYGVKAFDTLTSIAYNNSPAGGLKASVAPGSKIGIPNGVSATSDVTKATKNSTHYSTGGSIVDATNDTVNFAALSDGDSVMIVYATTGTATASNESSHTHAITVGVTTKYLIEYTP